MNADSPLAMPVAERRTPALGGFNLTFLSIEIRRLLRNRRTVVVTIVVLGNVGAGGTVATGTSVVLLGLLMAGLRGHPTLYLLSSQNGLLLVASASPDLSVSAALAVAVPLIPGLVLANAWLHP